MYNWELLQKLTIDVSDGIPKDIGRKYIPPDIRKQVVERDVVCKICGYDQHEQAHHINPRGDASVDNLVLLCVHCHNTVHLILYRMGKWKYCRVSKGNG